jgi:hypothetical protein
MITSQKEGFLHFEAQVNSLSRLTVSDKNVNTGSTETLVGN